MCIADLAQEQLDAGKHDDGLEHGEPLAVTVECLKQVLEQSKDQHSYCHMEHPDVASEQDWLAYNNGALIFPVLVLPCR